jgi:hypothetical protein
MLHRGIKLDFITQYIDIFATGQTKSQFSMLYQGCDFNNLNNAIRQFMLCEIFYASF